MPHQKLLSDQVFGLPEPEPFTPRNVSEHHGADRVAAAYCGITAPYPPIHGVWAHGWFPRHECGDHHLTRAYLDYHRRIYGREDFWPSLTDPLPVVEEFGWTARAIGLPLIYLPTSATPRRRGSLLVMPIHTLDGIKQDWDGDEYAETIARIRGDFREVVISITPGCLKAGYWVKGFQARGFPIVQGGYWTDGNSLKRVQTMLSTFEFVTTNGFGSHIAFGAYFGAKVSIYGKFAVESCDNYVLPSSFFDRMMHHRSECVLREHYPFLFCRPIEAQTHVDWARDEVGYQNKVQPGEMRELFRWTDARLRWWRQYGRFLFAIQRDALALRRGIGRMFPERIRHWLHAAVSPKFRRQQREINQIHREMSLSDVLHRVTNDE